MTFEGSPFISVQKESRCCGFVYPIMLKNFMIRKNFLIFIPEIGPDLTRNIMLIWLSARQTRPKSFFQHPFNPCSWIDPGNCMATNLQIINLYTQLGTLFLSNLLNIPFRMAQRTFGPQIDTRLGRRLFSNIFNHRFRRQNLTSASGLRMPAKWLQYTPMLRTTFPKPCFAR